jgi:hypothetical protein
MASFIVANGTGDAIPEQKGSGGSVCHVVEDFG